MPIGIFIPADDSVELTVLEFSSLADYQTAIGGYIELVDLIYPRWATAQLVVNEEGKLQARPVNRRATLLLWIHHPAFRFRDEVVGDAVLIGKTATGSLADTPRRLRGLLLEESEFAIALVEKLTDATKRVSRVGQFRSWVNAYVVAADVAAIQPDNTDVYVMPT